MAVEAQAVSQMDPQARFFLRDEGEGVMVMTFPPKHVDGIGVRQMYEAAADLTNQRNARLLVDLSGVPMVSSGVMGMLLTIKKKFLQSGGQVHIAVPDQRVMTTFHIMNLHLVLPLFPNPEEARKKFKT